MTLQRMKVLKDETKRQYEQKLELLTIAQNQNANQEIITDLQTQVEYLRMEYIDIQSDYEAMKVEESKIEEVMKLKFNVSGQTMEGKVWRSW